MFLLIIAFAKMLCWKERNVHICRSPIHVGWCDMLYSPAVFLAQLLSSLKTICETSCALFSVISAGLLPISKISRGKKKNQTRRKLLPDSKGILSFLWKCNYSSWAFVWLLNDCGSPRNAHTVGGTSLDNKHRRLSEPGGSWRGL